MEKRIGVIVGRFQVSELTYGHISLIEHALYFNDEVLVFIGVAPTKGERCNPLTYEIRKDMIKSAYPNVEILPIKDIGNVIKWNAMLDSLLEPYKEMNYEITLYGSRDSMVTTYQGKYKTEYVEPEFVDSGTNHRKLDSVYSKDKNTKDFRRGIIFAAYDRFPSGYPTVDIICVDGDMLLLGKKPFQDKHCMIGGFFDPSVDTNYENAAIREFEEETGLKVKDPYYFMSTIIDDWRYKKEVDKIISTVFIVEYQGGTWKANDDISELKWFNIRNIIVNEEVDTFLKTSVISHHREIIRKFIEYYKIWTLTNLKNK